MKRNLLSIFTLLVSSLFIFVSCDEDNSETYVAPDNVVRFLNGDEMITVPEASGEIIEIPVAINNKFSGPVTVYYEIEGNSENYKMLSEYGESVVAPGETSGVILLMPIDNDEQNIPSNSIIVRITGSDVGYALPDDLTIGYAEKIVVFEDDDEAECTPGAEVNWEGNLTCEDVGYGDVPAVGTLIEGECNQMIITGNLPNSNAQVNADFIFEFSDDGDAGTVTCARQPYGDTGYAYEGSGTYDVSTGQITVDYAFINPDGEVQWTGTNIIYK